MSEHWRRAAQGAALLKRGRYREGFPLYDAWRLDPANTDKAPLLPFARWSGQDVAGRRILIWSEHGLGDQIMYARFAKLLEERGAQVSWLCHPALCRVFEVLGVEILPTDRSIDLACEYYIPSSSLPLGFDFEPATVPADPYLRAEPCVAGGIGVMTACGRPDSNRNLPAEADLVRRLGGRDLSPEVTGAKDFYDTARIIAGLDLVVTVDTAVAHLAGAMGKPVWILLPADADWRWLEDRADSPLYPSARLFRCGAGAWAELLEAVVTEAQAR